MTKVYALLYDGWYLWRKWIWWICLAYDRDMKFFAVLDRVLSRVAQWIIQLYQFTLSPDKGLPSLRLKGRICMHEPHCSEYGKLCLQRYGFFHSIRKITSRVFSCTGGMHKIYDPEYYKVVFFSSAPIGVPFLEKLSEDTRFEVTGVVTMPDAPAGRGMKMQENVVKIKAKEIQGQSTKAQVQKSTSLRALSLSAFGRRSEEVLLGGGVERSETTKQSSSSVDAKYNFILLHGLTGRPDLGFLPWLKENLENLGHSVSVPKLPQPDDLALDEKIDYVLSHCTFDEHTIILGHSLGSLVAMKVIEKLDMCIAGFVSVAGMYDRRVTPERKKAKPHKYTTYDDYVLEYGPITRNIELLKKNCSQFMIVSDPHDSAVPPQHQEKLAHMFNAPLVQQNPQDEHFCGDQEPVILESINALLQKLATSSLPRTKLRGQELAAEVHDGAFIQTPNSLRLDSKKYGDEAQQFKQWLQDKKPDFLVVIAYGKIIPQHILDIPTFGPINVHGSILPKYRGASPIQSVFLQNEQETGITIMKMDAGLDTGDMIDTAKFPIAFHWTAKDVIGKMQEVGPQFLVDTLRKYGKGLLGEVKQDDTQATHCGKIEKEDGLIDPYSDSMQSIYSKYRAYILWPKIYWMHGEKRVIVEQLVLDEELFAINKDKPLISSVIARKEHSDGRGNPSHTTWIASSQSSSQGQLNPCIKTLTVKPEGSKSQSWDDFVKGYGK